MSTKISQLTSATDITASDLMQIVDVEDGVMASSGTNKKITAQLLADDLAGIVSDGSIATSKLASGALPSGVTVSSTNIVNGTIVDADVSASAAIAGSKVSPSFTAPSVISVNSSSDALRITQTGGGNALVVEDSTNPDATPFVVNPNGKVISGSTLARTFRNIYTGGQVTPRIQIQGDIGDEACSVIFHSQDGAGSGFTGFARSRGTLEAPVALQNGDYIGVETYQAYDGIEFLEAARIISIIDANVSIGDVSAAIVFATNPPGTGVGVSERMRITSSGNVGIGTSTPNASCLLDLSSTTRGFRPPSMTTAQRDLIASPVAGVMIYNTTTNKLNFYNGSAWEAVTSSV